MLEAERAGARALVVSMDEFARNSEAGKILRPDQADEAHNGALIGKLLEKSGTPYSHATGKFYDKAVAVKGPRARLEFLIRGLKWAVKKFEHALPQLDPQAREVFIQMRDSHLRTIAACERLAQALPA